MKALSPRVIWTITVVISVASLTLASFATVMVLLPNNTAAQNLASECTLGTSSIARNATTVPIPLAPGPAVNRTVYLQTSEVCAEIEQGTSYFYWTFNGTVPGPMLRVRQGDNVTVTIHNAASSSNIHSIDLHAVIGPGGGMMPTQTLPGSTTRFWFNARHPGLYVYHCATPSPDSHIANGMYGMILVEPSGGLPVMDKEFYVMQGELYTNAAKGTIGHHAFSSAKMITGIPDFVLFNGRVGALTGPGSLSVQTGQKVRIYFGVGGPNLDSSFHIIGEIFDTVYLFGTTDPNARLQDVQTVSVPPGGSTIVEFVPLVPSSQAYGSYTIVDHSLAWAIQKGAAGTLTVTGTATPGVFGT